MKTALNLLTRTAMAVMLALALTPAHAEQAREGRGREANRPDARYGDRQVRAPRRSPQAQRPGEEPRAQRLSPEERQQLRRDIKDAGKEIYPPRR